ncbi:MAG: hypothetical protein AB1894_09615 [Chloroflexota bacterium]
MKIFDRLDGGLKWLAGVMLLAIGLKLWLVTAGLVPFNSDEAVVGLMARHILQGETPVFFYGQAYMGSLDAWLVAFGFRLFGEQVWVIRLVQSLLYLGVLCTTAGLGKAAFGSWKVGVVAAGLLAIPTVNVTLYTTASLGGYGEALLLGNLTLLVGLRIIDGLRQKQTARPFSRWVVVGFLMGLGLWAFGLTLIYSLPVIVMLAFALLRVLADRAAVKSELQGLLRSSRQGRADLPWAVTTLVAGFLLGSVPWWSFALQNGFQQLIWELQGGAIAGVEKLPWLLRVGQHLVSLLVLGSTVVFGARPPWDVFWLGLPLLPFIMIFWLAVVVHIVQCMRAPNAYRRSQFVLLLVMVTLATGFVFSSFGADPSGRYFVPLAVPLALFGASLILQAKEKFGRWAYGLLALVLVYNFWGTMQCALQFPPGITTQFYAPSRIDHRYDQELIDFLRANGETHGYGNYWVTYPLAFLSQEELIFVPRLPYHPDFRYTERDDRYEPYDQQVEASSRVAYITTNHLELDEHLRQSFSELGVAWQEAKICDYQVFYGLSRPVRPAEMGLGTTTP